MNQPNRLRLGKTPVRNNAPALIKPHDPSFSERRYRDEPAGSFGSDRGRAANADLCNETDLILQKYYPGYPWFTEADVRNGVLQICLPVFTKFSYVLHIKNLDGPGQLDRAVKHAAGAFLECYDIPRSGFSIADYLSALQKVPIRGQGAKPG